MHYYKPLCGAYRQFKSDGSPSLELFYIMWFGSLFVATSEWIQIFLVQMLSMETIVVCAHVKLTVKDSYK